MMAERARRAPPSFFPLTFFGVGGKIASIGKPCSASYTLERPMYWSEHGINDSADRGIVPDVPEL